MNDQQFERDTEALRHRGYVSFVEAVRARDTAQREALAQLQAEMPDLRANMTKALDLLQVLTSTKYTDRAFVEAVDEADEMLEQLRGKVVLKGLADQQEAQEVGPLKGEFAEAAEQAFREQYGLQEAQGAQAGDDAIKLFERIISRSPADLDKATEDNPWYQVMASEVRAFAAALATQPAAGEPIHQWADQDLWMDGDEADMASARAEGLKTRTLWTAPPAAAHGDDTRRIDWLACTWRLGGKLPEVDHGSFREVIDAAMRAQGDGEVQ